MILRFRVPTLAALLIASTAAAACPGYDVTVSQASASSYNPVDLADTILILQLSASSGALPTECEIVPVQIEGLRGEPQPLQFIGADGGRLATELLSGPDATFAFQSLSLTADARARLVRGQTVTIQVGRLRAGQFLRTGAYRATVRVLAGNLESSGTLGVTVAPAMLLRSSSADGVEDILLAGDPQTGASGSTVFFYRTNADLKVSATSRNNGALVHRRGAEVGRIPYSATLDGMPLDFAGGPAVLDLHLTQTSLQSRTITVQVPSAGSLPAGRYEDVITFSFAAF